jgi:branched-chain amino acid transport system ATP-binding protein
MLEVKDLSVDIESASILRRITLIAGSGGLYGLVGANGAGKTTLVRALAGALKAKSGSIRLDERELTSVESYSRARMGVGYMPEDRRLVPGLSVQDNILAPAWAQAMKGWESRLAWVYDLMPHLHRVRDQRAIALSGGQQKLVALARALMTGNRLLLLDEPSEGVAPALAQSIISVLASLRGSGPTILVTESDEKYLKPLAQAIFHIERGEIVQTAYC